MIEMSSMSALSDCYAQAPHAVYMASNLRAPALRVVLVAILIATLPMTAVMIGLSATLRDQASAAASALKRAGLVSLLKA